MHVAGYRYSGHGVLDPYLVDLVDLADVRWVVGVAASGRVIGRGEVAE